MVSLNNNAAQELASRLIDFVNSFAGRIKGGLGAVTVVACAMFGSIGGSCSSAVAAIGTIMIPRMEENGYSRGYTTAIVACSSILGQLIPPSVPMILFALVTYQSIPGCWLATIGPGIIVIGIFCTFNFYFARKMPVAVMPRLSFKEQINDITKSTIFQQADMVMHVKEPQPSEYEQIRDGQIVFTYLHH